MKTISQLNKEIDSLSSWLEIARSERVCSLIRQIQKENDPKVAELKKELEELKGKRPVPKPRFPSDTPAWALDIALDYFTGTTEIYKYRIHCWNDNFVWVSFPAGTYHCFGKHQGQATFYLLSRTERELGKPKSVEILYGRVTLKQMKQKIGEMK